jgi:hypothetical protein
MFDADVPGRNAGGTNVVLDGGGQRGRPADVRLAPGEIGHELAQVPGREQVSASGDACSPATIHRSIPRSAASDSSSARGTNSVSARTRQTTSECGRAPRRGRPGVMPIPPVTSTVFSRRRSAVVKVPNGPLRDDPRPRLDPPTRSVKSRPSTVIRASGRPAPRRARTDAPPTSRAGPESAGGRTARHAPQAIEAPARDPERHDARALDHDLGDPQPLAQRVGVRHEQPKDDDQRERREAQARPVVGRDVVEQAPC